MFNPARTLSSPLFFDTKTPNPRLILFYAIRARDAIVFTPVDVKAMIPAVPKALP
jgi:hypothetical protein